MTAVITPTPTETPERRRSRRRLNQPSVLETVLTYVTLVLIVLISLFPFYWMIRTAFTPSSDAFSTDPTLLPAQITWDNLVRVLTSDNMPFVQQFWNTAVVSFATTGIVLLFGITGAYALARLQFVGRRQFGMALLVVQMFPGVLLIIPLFVLMVRLNLDNTHLGLVLAYSTGALPFTVWFLRSYFLSIPEELGDAGRIDGCTHLGVLFRIVLPLARPGVAAVATLSVVNAWNEFLLAFVLINDIDKKVLSVGLSSFIEQFRSDYTGLFAAATLTTLPIVIIFLLFQRHLVGGLAAGGVKG